MKKLEEKATAAANIYVQQSLHEKVGQEECWTAKEDYIAGYCLGNVSAHLHSAQKIAKAMRLLSELIRVADYKQEYHSSSAARFILEVLK
jgi:pimeloyl-CoA synthetase